MPAAIGTGLPLRLPIVYPIGFLKGSDDTYGKFLTQGDKWQIETYTSPENGTLYINPSAVATSAPGGAKGAKITSVLRFDQIDADGNGVRSEVQLNTDELWQTSVGYYKKVGKDEHRVLAEYGYAVRNADGARRIPLLSDLSGKDFKGKPIKVGYRVISSDYHVVVEADAKRQWQFNVSGNVGGAVVGGKVADEGEGPSFDLGVGGKHDLAQGYLKFSQNAKGGRNATVLVHPRLDTSKTFGLTVVAKAVVDVNKSALSEAGLTVTGGVSYFKGWEWKANATQKGGKISVSEALIAKLPGKWVLGLSAAAPDVSSLNLKDVKIGVRLIQGSTPAPL